MKATLAILVTALVSASPALAQQAGTPQSAPTPPQSESPGSGGGTSACGGVGPIQGGLPVQPTPSRDECLARLHGTTLTPGNKDVELGAQGVPQVQVPYPQQPASAAPPPPPSGQ